MRLDRAFLGAIAGLALLALAYPAYADDSTTSAVAPATSASPAPTDTATTAPDAIGVSIATGDDNPCADVPTDSFAYKAIVQLHAMGYLKGYPDGLFHG